MKCSVRKFHISFTGDTQGLDQVIVKERIKPSAIVAIISKTVGNGALNDYTRQFTELSFSIFLNQKYKIPLMEINKKIIFITSSGSEGIVTPHGYLIYKEDSYNICNSSNGKRENNKNERKKIKEEKKGLVIGTANSCKVAIEKIGKIDQVLLVAETTRKALCNSGISSIEDIGVVFVKSPVSSLNENVSNTNILNPKHSIPLTRAASALGVGLALGEISESAIKPEIIGTNMDIYSKKAFAFSGNEVEDCRVLILGNSNKGNSDLYINSRVFKDLMDIEGIYDFLKDNEQKNLVGIFAKVSIDPHGILRGQKVPIDYNDIRFDRVLRAVASGILVPVLKDTEVFISGGSEHQGPRGGGILAGIFRSNFN